MANIRIAVFEDNKLLREGFVQLFNFYEGYQLCGIYPNAKNIYNDIILSKPDVILLDIQMPDISGIDALKLIRTEFPDLKIIIQTVFEDDDSIFNAICLGANGYLLKKSTPQEYINSINEVLDGGAPLTPSVAKKVLLLFRNQHQNHHTKAFNLSERETEILQHLVNGLSYKMIADTCNISYNTVRFHMKNIYEKLQVESMTEAVSLAIINKLV